jgi:hypothetical protein
MLELRWKTLDVARRVDDPEALTYAAFCDVIGLPFLTSAATSRMKGDLSRACAAKLNTLHPRAGSDGLRRYG